MAQQNGQYLDKGIFIADIKPRMEISGIFVIVNPALNQSSSGSPFWRFSIADRTGILEAKIWFPESARYEKIPPSWPARIKGDSSLYKNKIQVTVKNLEILGEEEVLLLNPENFIRSSSQDIEKMWNELRNLYITELTHAPWRKLFNFVFNDPEIAQKFKRSPAAISIHHAWLGGLLEHTLSVAKICMALADLYPFLDRQTLLAGAVFHDIGKIREYQASFSITSSNEGSLAGHGYLGLELLLPFIQKSRLEPALADHLKHLILSHHGEPEYGAARVPQTMEAFILHFADNIDARMMQCQTLFENEKMDENSWSTWQKTLERRLFKPVATPLPESQQKNPAREEICLSLLKE